MPATLAPHAPAPALSTCQCGGSPYLTRHAARIAATHLAKDHGHRHDVVPCSVIGQWHAIARPRPGSTRSPRP